MASMYADNFDGARRGQLCMAPSSGSEITYRNAAFLYAVYHRLSRQFLSKRAVGEGMYPPLLLHEIFTDPHTLINAHCSRIDHGQEPLPD